MNRRFTIKPWILLLGAALLLAGALVFSFLNTDGGQPAIETGSVSMAVPAQTGMARAAHATKQFFLRLFGKRDIDVDYERLKQENMVLQNELSQLSEVDQENQRLNQLLGVAQANPEYEYMSAQVVERDPNSWFSYILINRGAKDGIKVDNAVVTEKGLVGRVVDVGGNWAKVLCLTDRQSAVSAMVERTRDMGVVKGATDEDSSEPVCSVYYLSYDSELVPGDIMLTSSIGGIFPRGIVIGTVVEVSRDQNQQKYASVLPSVDFARLEDVLVVKGETGFVKEDLPTPAPNATTNAGATPDANASPTGTEGTNNAN